MAGCTRRKANRKVKEFYDDLMSSLDAREDTDKMFSYYSKIEVMFLDRRLGITYYVLCALVAGYIIGYMFIYKKGYLQYEQANGATVTHVFGDAVAESSGNAGSRYFSTEELIYPGLENGAVFVATRQVVHRQFRGYCEDPRVACISNADCTRGGAGTCTENGFCKEHSWCTQSATPEIYELDTGTLLIWLRSTIQYLKIAPTEVFSSEMHDPAPRRGQNVFSVRELLMMCKPLPVRYEEVAELGAVIEVQLFWECFVKSNNIVTSIFSLFKSEDDKNDDCKPSVQARRLDTVFDSDNIGFGFSYPEYLSDDERDQNDVTGIRLIFKTTGLGRKVSVSATITKASLGASLFGIAKIIADLLMTKVFALKRKYNARKYEYSPDFSEHMRKVEERNSAAVTDKMIDEEERQVRQKEEDWMKKLDEEDE